MIINIWNPVPINMESVMIKFKEQEHNESPIKISRRRTLDVLKRCSGPKRDPVHFKVNVALIEHP